MDTLKRIVRILQVLAEIAVDTDCAPIVVQIGRENYEPNNVVFVKQAPPIVIETLVKNEYLCSLESDGMRIGLPLSEN